MDKGFDKEVYLKIYEGEKVNCFWEGCRGYIKKVAENRKFYANKKFFYKEDSIICRCTRNCKHKLVLIKNDLSSKVVKFKF